MAKGIRVNQLAKELGVTSRAIMDKLEEQGLSDKAPNHMSVLSLGLAESVREWLASQAGGTAVQTAAPPEVATKPKTARRKKKAETEEAPAHGAEPEPGASPEAPEAEPAVSPSVPAEPVVPEVSAEASAPAEVPVQAEAPVAEPEPAVAELPAEVVAPAPVQPAVAEVAAPGAEASAAPAVAAPAGQEPPPVVAEAPAAPEPKAHAPGRPAAKAPGHHAAKGPGHGPKAPPAAARKAVPPAPILHRPEPAKMAGPKLVRQEKPDILPPLRRGPRMGGPSEPPAFTQARAQTGRGVKVSDEEGEDAEAKKKAAKGRSSSLSARRRGPDGRRGEADEKLREFTDADLLERKERLLAATSYHTGIESRMKKSGERGQHQQAKSVLQRGEPVRIEEPITVKTLSAALGVKVNDIMGRLMRQGVMATINQTLNRAVAETIALDLGVELQVEQEATLDEQLQAEFDERPADEASLRPRAPVVTILGHVDHGKTSLLDKIRNANVAAGEAGGITQHIAAWMVQLGDKRVTFIDTPGHQAFTSMRARGADMTDVVVLVVSAAEGVQPQTIESINHAKAAGVPIVVAMNKIDRPDANPDMVMGQLAKEGLNPVEWGGETEVVRTSAITGAGVKELIEILDYQSELLELKADPTAPARGTVIESRMDEGLGSVATVLVQDGTLKAGDVLLAGAAYGRVRSLLNDRGEPVQDAGPATPVIVSGLVSVPNAGDRFYAVNDMERARTMAEDRQTRARQETLAGRTQVTLSEMLTQLKAGEVRTINLIVKADVQGSVETLNKALGTLSGDEVKVRVIHSGVGSINESDVDLAVATRNTGNGRDEVAIIGFHVVPEEAARAMAEQHHISVKLYRVIYEIFDDLKKAMSGMLAPEVREKLHGHVEIRQVFKVSRMGNIAGCFVTDGHIQRGSKIRLIRNDAVLVQDLSIESLKRLKDDVREVKAGLECGIKLAGYDDIKVGDRLEAYVREMFQRTL